jgi:hypothetical protein
MLYVKRNKTYIVSFVKILRIQNSNKGTTYIVQ